MNIQRSSTEKEDACTNETIDQIRFKAELLKDMMIVFLSEYDEGIHEVEHDFVKKIEDLSCELENL